MIKNNYNIEHIIDSLYNRHHTNFITQKELKFVRGRLNKNEYQIYKLYEDSNKVILYKKEPPSLKLYKIASKTPLRHQDILGTIFSLGIKEDTFGDIIKYEGDYYIFLLPHLETYFISNFQTVKDIPISLISSPLNITANFHQEYQYKEYIVSSLRIDNVISSITNESREEVLKHFKNKEIILNYSDELKPTRLLRENDIFSIRKYGKYKFLTIVKNTKKGSFIISIAKYI